MNGLRCMSIPTMAVLALALAPTGAAAQQKPLKEQLVGAWTLVSANTKNADGTPSWDANPTGMMILTESGHYSNQILRSDLPKFASNNRMRGTPEEYKTIMQGSISSFGTYTVNEANKTFTIRYDGSTFPNRKGTLDTRPVVIEGDQLRIVNPAPTSGGEASQLIYRRAK
jgi:hypothetical protein